MVEAGSENLKGSNDPHHVPFQKERAHGNGRPKWECAYWWRSVWPLLPQMRGRTDRHSK